MGDTFLVGGAVRDKLLGLSVHERDWLVVGATPEQMLSAGFQAVGKDFPVFLHPETHEEYALARTERKIATGYKGFSFYTSPDITIEQDLQRRDLTINAIAEDASGKLIDPYGGEDDIQQRVLRHVSPAFKEDPVRILRLARFAARFAHLGFSVANETISLAKNMVDAGEINALVAERVWQECHKALLTKNPEVFFEVLAMCNALVILFPSIANKLDEVRRILKQVSPNTNAPLLRFAALVSVLSETELRELKHHCAIPKAYIQLGTQMIRYQPLLLRAKTAVDYLVLLEKLDAFRRPESVNQFSQASKAMDVDAQQLQKLSSALETAGNVQPSTLDLSGLEGKAIGQAMRQARLNAIANTISS